jgi:hypothetical protein
MRLIPSKESWADVFSVLTVLGAAGFGVASYFRPDTNLTLAIFVILVTFVTSEFLKNSLLNEKILRLSEPQTIHVQCDRRSNYYRGAEILMNASVADTIWLSFLEHSSMWGRSNQLEDNVFDDALAGTIKRNCSVAHVIRCDRKTDLDQIVEYINGFGATPNYSVFLMTTIEPSFHPLDILVIREKVAQIEFPQPYANPIRMGPAVELTDSQAVQFVEEYARLLIGTSTQIKDQNGIKQLNIDQLRVTLTDL